MRPGIADAIRRAGGDPETLWCRGCSTALEDLRDGVIAGGPAFLTLIASVAAFVPGIGTGVAAALGAAAALARGENVSDAMVAGARAAIPGSAAMEVGYAAGSSLARGERIDQAVVAGGRALAEAEGGPQAAAAYDAMIAIAQGRSLQDAGFAALRYYARGNDLAEKGLDFADRASTAVLEGRDVKDALAAQLAAEVKAAAPGVARDQLEGVIAQVVRDPKLRDMGSDALAWALHVSEPVARAAQALVDANGQIDSVTLEVVAPRTGVAVAAEKYGEAFVASRAANATYVETKGAIKQDQLSTALRLSPSSLSFAQAKREAAGTSDAIDKYGAAAVASADTNQTWSQTAAALRPAPAIVAAGGPLGGQHSTVGQDLLLGATVAGALGALYFWATRGRAA